MNRKSDQGQRCEIARRGGLLLRGVYGLREDHARPLLFGALLFPQLIRDELSNRALGVLVVDDALDDKNWAERSVGSRSFAIALKLHADGRVEAEQAALLAINVPEHVRFVNGRWLVGVIMQFVSMDAQQRAWCVLKRQSHP